MRNSEKNLDEERGDERYQEIEREYLPYVERSDEFERFQKNISDINKEARQITMDRTLDKKEKRKQLDALEREKQSIFKEAYERRPSAMPEEERRNLEQLLDTYESGAPIPETMQKQAPVTSELLTNISTGMNQNQLERLAKAAGYQPRGE